MDLFVKGARFYAQEEGEGELTLVFLHYFGGSSLAWNAMTPMLRGGYRCLMLDLRGFGDSDAPSDGYEMFAQANDVAAILRERDIRRYVLVGHSMGGKIALSFAACRPPGLEALVLLAPSPPIPEPMRETERHTLLTTHGQRDAAAKTAHQIIARPLSHAAMAQVERDNLRSSAMAWRAWLERGSREDIRADSDRVDAPSLLILGERDPVMDAAMLRREVADALPRCETAVIAGAGHLLPLEAPQETAQMMTAWLNSKGLQGG